MTNKSNSFAGQIIYQLDKRFVKRLLKHKIRMDFANSVLHELSLSANATAETSKRLSILKENEKGDFRRFLTQESFDWLLNELDNFKDEREKYEEKKDPNHTYKMSSIERIGLGVRGEEARELLAKRGKTIYVNCECIETGALATFIRLKETWGIDIDIYFADPSGVEQMNTVAVRNGKYDFVVTANAAFFLYGSTLDNVQRQYRHEFEIHSEQQVILSKRDQGTSLRRKFLLYTMSSAEEHSLVMKKQFLNGDEERKVEFEMIDHYRDLKEIIYKLDSGEYAISWEPLTSVLLNDKEIVRSRETYYNWISLFSHNRWHETDMKTRQEHDAFRYLFFREWQTGVQNVSTPIRAIKDSSDYKDILKSFKVGAGVVDF